MRLPACLSLIVLASGVAVCRPVLAQSLGDVSRQEEERRKDVKAPAKIYTDKALRPAPVIPSDESRPSKSDSTPAASDKAADAAKDDGAKGGSKDEPKDQKYWSTRRKDLQAKLE